MGIFSRFYWGAVSQSFVKTALFPVLRTLPYSPRTNISELFVSWKPYGFTISNSGEAFSQFKIVVKPAIAVQIWVYVPLPEIKN